MNDIVALIAVLIGTVLAFFGVWTSKRHPGQSNEAKLRALQAEVNELRSDIASLQAKVEALLEQVAQDHVIKREQAAEIQELKRRLAALTGRTNGLHAPSPQGVPSKQLQSRLRDILKERFSDDELRALICDVTGNPEAVSGSTKLELAQNLVMYCVNRDRVADLVLAIRQARPNVEIPDA